MKQVPINIFPIAKTALAKDAVREWLDSVGASEVPVPDAISDAEAVTGLAAKRCYMAFAEGLNPNVTRVRSDWSVYFDNILKSGHGSVLEHASWTFAIEGVSRVFTGELNRHRAGAAISEGSMRYIRFDDLPYWEPLSIQPGSTSLDGLAGHCGGKDKLEEVKKDTRELFAQTFKTIEEVYDVLCVMWRIQHIESFADKKKLTSMFRRLIPMGVATGGVWTFNGRALRHILTMRCSSAAEEEICYVFTRIAKMMLEDEARIFGDFYEDEFGFMRPKYVKV